MSMTINGIELTKEEMQTIAQTLEAVYSEPDGARKLLEVNFENGAQIHSDIVRGVDEFFTLYAQEFTTEDIREKLTKAIEGLSPAKQLLCLTNVLIAMSYTGSTLYMSDAWNDRIEACKATLGALEAGAISEEEIPDDTIPELMDLVCDHIESSAVLLTGSPLYEGLMNACETASPEEMECIAANTRENSIAMASTLYTLHMRGHLESLKDQQYTPYTMGVLTASALEIDAAAKTGLWEKIKPIVIKVSKVVLFLLIAAAIYNWVTGVASVIAMDVWAVLDPAYLSAMHYGFDPPQIVTTIRELGKLTGIILSVDAAPQLCDLLCNVGAKVLRTPAKHIRSAWISFKNWVANHVLPVMLNKWRACSNFVHTRIIAPLTGAKHNTAPATQVDTAPAAQVDTAPIGTSVKPCGEQATTVRTEPVILT